ncbi:extracellular sulfatase Sulf [Mytilus galloprovincialis]|uniref:Extracellular sulfatase Sulf n=1 Tax=Mytilus galloprovincialis TaxID=29158 RepID=A0A8B6DI63_MYTGA|nr:extracellular sulfatase Sulf [Mytilus galloprovincialis]
MCILTLICSCIAQRSPYKEDIYNRRSNKKKKNDKPNIIVIITDDQDELLGSMHVMPKTLKWMRDQGVHFNNSFVSTPMCCPSRSSFLTGMYTHNHHVYTNNENCSSPYWQANHESRSFATYLSNAGYRTGYFGKYLNEYNGTYIPAGWREWLGLVKNSRFYNYTVNFNGQKMKHEDNYYQDYFTDLIANDSVTFLKRSKQYFPKRPVLMVLSTPAPHGPEDAAPQYQHLFYNNTFHRTPSWNVAPNYDKQYLLKVTGKMEPIEQRFTDVLQQKRLQTLQSVDDLVDKVCNELWMLGELDNTYILYTSDHGYHLGQYGVIKGKALPYDFDTRVPLYMRGPGILPRSKISNMVLNIDIAATILDIAGLEIPDHFDGKSILRLIKAYRDPQNVDSKGFVKTRKPWGDTVLLERGKITGKRYKDMMREQKRTFLENPETRLLYATPKQKRIYKECAKPENQPPCKVNQKYQCIKDPKRKLPRLMKCRPGDETKDLMLNDNGPPCHCKKRRKRRRIARLQRKYLQTQMKTSNLRSSIKRKKRSYINSVDENSVPPVSPIDRRCRVLQNNTVSCDQILYQDADAWKNHKDQLDDMIQEYRKMLEDLRKYRRHLKKEKPRETFLSQFDKNDEFLESVGLPGTSPACKCDTNQTNFNARKEAIKEARKERRKRKRKNKNKKRKRDCNQNDLKCTIHNNNQWKTPPLWNSSYWNLQSGEKLRRRDHPACKRDNMDCSIMDNSHWKTQPYWTNGPFCFCSNSNNNTYWCLRTINSTHDLLYCEFINNFISYYDLTEDPFQLKNAIHDVNYGVPSRSRKAYDYNTTSSAEDAQKKFGNAKAISSDQYFGGRDSDFETKQNLQKFQGSNSISSDDYFGDNSSKNRSYNSGPDLQEIKDGVRQGVTKVAGKISSIASGVMTSLQRKS